MPLFRISVLALLLLPLSLSCDSDRSPADVRGEYSPVVETQLNATITHVTILLRNTSCKDVKLRHKLPTCRPDITSILSTLHNLTCKMKNLGVQPTDKLSASVLTSLRCPCPSRPTRGPSASPGRRRTTRRRRSGHPRSYCETKRRCRALEILSKITECYQMLNTQLVAK